jgi:outer membrane protein, multidrug efflux system
MSAHPLHRWALLPLLAAALGGCALLGPPAAPPPTAAAAEALLAKPAGTRLESRAAKAALDPFASGFGRADLAALQTQALQANPDIASAAARLAEVRALLQQTSSAGQPALGLGAGAERARSQGSTANAFSVGLQSRWEIDLFGALAADRAAAAAQVRASEAGLEAARVAVAAAVVSAWADEQTAQERLALTRSTLTALAKTRELVQARADAGRGTRLDIERIAALQASTAANLPLLEAAVQRARWRLDVLRGLAPSSAAGMALATAAVPLQPLAALKPLADITDPRALLERRPDLLLAAAQFDAAAAGGDAARRRLWPQLTLNASAGVGASRVADLGRSSALLWGLGAELAWSLLDGGAKQAAIAAADARSAQAAAAYQAAVLLALEDAALALDQHRRQGERALALIEAERAATAAAQLALARFEAGASDFLAVLDAERERLAAVDRLADARASQVQALVSVYRSLAGAW